MMRFSGRVFRVGRQWAVEVPALGVVSQGHTRKDALDMIRDAVESLANKPDFEVRIYPDGRDRFEIGASKDAPLVALREDGRMSLTLDIVSAVLYHISSMTYIGKPQDRFLREMNDAPG